MFFLSFCVSRIVYMCLFSLRLDILTSCLLHFSDNQLLLLYHHGCISYLVVTYFLTHLLHKNLLNTHLLHCGYTYFIFFTVKNSAHLSSYAPLRSRAIRHLVPLEIKIIIFDILSYLPPQESHPFRPGDTSGGPGNSARSARGRFRVGMGGIDPWKIGIGP